MLITKDNIYSNYFLTNILDELLNEVRSKNKIIMAKVLSFHSSLYLITIYNLPFKLSFPRRVITSQLQPTFARRAFPCYDEPHRKAVFRTTIYAPVEYPVVRSNMPKRTETDQLK